MYPKQHLFFGIIFSLILLLLFPQIGLIGFFLILFSTVLIDVDHYLYYVYKKKNWNLKNAYNWYIKEGEKWRSLPRKQRNRFYMCFCFLHGIEILLVLLLLSIISKYFFYIFIGITFHLILDILDQIRYRDRMDKLSILYDFLKFKKLKFIEDNDE